MATSSVQLTPEQRQAIAAQSLYIEDVETQETYLLLKTGKFPELEEEYFRARLEEGSAAIERGEEEEWDSASIKAEDAASFSNAISSSNNAAVVRRTES